MVVNDRHNLKENMEGKAGYGSKPIYVMNLSKEMNMLKREK